jgi:hypothetical protein
MKIVYLLIGCSLLFSACLSHKTIVESDYSYQGQFKHYKSFNFLANTDSSQRNQIVEKAIKYRMNLQGYRFKEKKPSLYVVYSIYDKKLDFKGNEQPTLKDWLRSEDENEKYKFVDYELQAGALLISLVDRKKNQVVWQGYSSSSYTNLLSTQDEITERQLRWSVSSIFDQYSIFASSQEELR